jgi:hypothetical protein
MKVGDLFETEHGSKWEVIKVMEPHGLIAKTSDGVGYSFTPDGKFFRRDLNKPHPYDYKRPWAEREAEDKAKAEKLSADQAKADAEMRARAEKQQAADQKNREAKAEKKRKK